MVTIEFEDRGQDFLEWDIDERTLEIVACRPFQAFVWVGKKLRALPVVGDRPQFDDGAELKYKVVSVKHEEK